MSTLVEPASPARPAGSVITKALTVLASSALCVAALSLLAGGFDPVSGRPSLRSAATSLTVVAGNARREDERLIVDRLGSGERVVVAIPNARLRAADFRTLEIALRGLPAPENIAFVWSTRHSGGRTFLRGVDAVADGAVSAAVGSDPNWNGDIQAAGFVITGPTHGPMAIESMTVVTDSAFHRVLETLRDWLTFRGWNGNSINIIMLRSDLNPMSLTLFATLAVAAALALWWAMRRGNRREWVLGAVAIVACGWLVVDARWLAQLARQAAATHESFAAKSWRDRRMAMPDGALFAFLEQVKQSVGERPGRIFFGSDDAYLRSRAGYHLLPRNALSIVYHGRLHDPQVFRPGDYLCVYDQSGIAYDAVAGTLSWDGKAPLRAERTLESGPGALYRILP